MKEVEIFFSYITTEGVDSLSYVVPDIKHLLSPILDTTHKNQKIMGDIVLKEMKTTYSGYWGTFIYINGRTGQLRTENCCTFTLITVPIYIVEVNIPLYNKFVSLFKIGHKE